MKNGIELITERYRHRLLYCTPAHDDAFTDGVLAKVAGSLVAKSADRCSFECAFKPSDAVWAVAIIDGRPDRIDALVEAGAFIVAEIGRLQRQKVAAAETRSLFPF